MKNLVAVEDQQTLDAGAKQSIKGKLIGFMLYLKKLGRTESTIRTYVNYVEFILNAGANPYDPESAKLVIANNSNSRNSKRLATYAYDAFLKYLNIPWEKPEYRMEHKRVFIPTDEELQLAVNCGIKINLIFSKLIYETGCRANEASRVEWTDIDQERNKITIKASKHGNARIITVSKGLINQLLTLSKTEKTVFPKRKRGTRQKAFRDRMKKLARLHNNPRFLKIHYHTFRHCKALREYHKTKSILHVKNVLGHKSILTTQRYVDLYVEIYGDLKSDNYICESTSSIEKAKKLIKDGFEYVCEIDGEKLFRKVK